MTDKGKVKKKRFIRFLNKFHIPVILLIVAIYMTLVTIIWLVSYSADASITYKDIFLLNILTIFGNDYDYMVDTPAAILLGILMLIISMIGLSTVTGYISSAFVARKMNTGKGLKKMQKLKDHIIICGWQSDIKILLQDVLRKNKDMDPADIVLINNVDEEKMQALQQDESIKGINYLKGDFTTEQTLINANIKNASRVLIIGENEDNIDAELVDSRVFVATLLVKNLNPKCKICSEVKTERYRNYLEAQNCCEVVYTDQYTRYILSTSTLSYGISKVMASFLDDGNGVSVQIEKIDPSWIGKPFAELSGWYKKERGTLCLGLLENMGVEKEIKHQILSEAQKSTNYGEIVKKLKDVKNLETNYPYLNPKDDYIIKENTGAIILGEEI